MSRLATYVESALGYNHITSWNIRWLRTEPLPTLGSELSHCKSLCLLVSPPRRIKTGFGPTFVDCPPRAPGWRALVGSGFPTSAAPYVFEPVSDLTPRERPRGRNGGRVVLTQEMRVTSGEGAADATAPPHSDQTHPEGRPTSNRSGLGGPPTPSPPILHQSRMDVRSFAPAS